MGPHEVGWAPLAVGGRRGIKTAKAEMTTPHAEAGGFQRNPEAEAPYPRVTLPPAELHSFRVTLPLGCWYGVVTYFIRICLQIVSVLLRILDLFVKTVTACCYLFHFDSSKAS